MQYRSTATDRPARLAAAVAAVLALTVGAGALAVPTASAATTTAGSAEVGPVRSLTPGTTLRGAGTQGFFVRVGPYDDFETLRWIPYAGGSHRDFTYWPYGGNTETSGDALIHSTDGYNGSVRNMATGESFDSEQLPGSLDALFSGSAGSAIALRDARDRVWLDTKDAAPRQITGLPEGDRYGVVRPATSAHGLLTYWNDAGKAGVGLVDLATATVTETYPDVAAVSAARVAWTEPATATTPRRVVVRDRATKADTFVPVASTAASLPLGLLGDWVLYGTSARHLKTGETITLFQRADTVLTAPDGTAVVVQGSRAGTTGVHRVTLDRLGRPVVALLARSASAAAFVHDVDADGYPDLLGRDASGTLWRDSAGDGRGRKAVSGGWGAYNKIEAVGDPIGAGLFADVVTRDAAGVLWLHKADGKGGFHPRTKVGGGWQTYTKLAGGKDLNEDNGDDLVAVDTAGRLFFYGSSGLVDAPYKPRKQIGTGWGIYNQLTAVGNVGGASGADLVARDASGMLWLYLGKGDGTFTARKPIGGGWQVYGQITGAGDVDHDGRNDLLAHDPVTKRVYLYSGTGDWRRPFRTRVLTDVHAGAAYNHLA
ncbi:VCBS repeat-containing protein [Streptomyces sp. R302]|uniref:FG-GAP repeat domain-containing protein n=1 Tax=unclassified Streptomyces TaxID=2593676 RepID=UPI00145F8916|nr:MULTISPECIES: VCBS repeat-containing protein [unclassified Streptomyces]NML50213.1 VCBS repeat-containing protein [Streptomyces sp. R301]NML79204.1 VCBS repeat-containing protein [Streptomyces sp. R302]